MASSTIFARCRMPDSSETEYDFLESSYFRNSVRQSLPTPAEVRTASLVESELPHHRPVVFQALGLIVKYGTQVTVGEAQNLWAIRRFFGQSLPVPEVFGWRRDGNEVFIYMQLIEGVVLRDLWPGMSREQKEDTCSQLKSFMSALRQVKQDPSDEFVGSLDGGGLLDNAFIREPEAGPFPSIRQFHDWFALLPMKNLPEMDRYPHPSRPFLPDNVTIALTHADLHWGNVLMSAKHPSKVIAIIDWEQAGWYPDYWEFCKACQASHYAGEWRLEYLPRILEERDEEYCTHSEFVYAMGAHV